MEIQADNLVKQYRDRKAARGVRKVVDGISLEVKQGEVVGLLGPNGAGKTTTFYMIVGLLKPNSGKVLLDGQDITRRPMYQRARAGIGYLPQEASVFRNLTVEENLRLVFQMQRLSASQQKARAEQLMEDLGVTHRRDALGKVLSGGERRRVEIARALAANPKFILLDEPFTGVDPMAIEDIAVIIERLSKRENIGILITDHNVEAMLSITERAYIVADGQIKFEGRSDGLLENPEARAFYFGERYGYGRERNGEPSARKAAEEEISKLSGDWENRLDEEDDHATD